MQIQASIGGNQFRNFMVYDDILLEGKIKKGYWTDVKKDDTITIYRIKEESEFRYIMAIKEKNEVKKTRACAFDDVLPYFVSMTDIKEDGKPVSTQKVNVFECEDNQFFQVYTQVNIWFTRPIMVLRVKGLTSPKIQYEYHYFLTNKAVLPLWVVKICIFEKTEISKIPCRNRISADGLVKCRSGLSSGSELLEFVNLMDGKYKPENIDIEVW